MDGFHNPQQHTAASRAQVDSVLARVSRAGNSILSLLSGLLAAALILYSSYVLYDTFYTQTNAANSWNLLQYRPQIMDETPVPLSGGESLAAVNQDYRGWLTLYDTTIDFPLMQGSDDLFYATHDVYGEASITGSIYLAAGNTRGMTDTYNIVYGHHMDNGAMFGSLDSYIAEAYANAHREGVVVSSSGVYDLTVFAVAETNAYEDKIYTVGNRADEVISFLQENIGGGPTTNTLYFDAAVAANTERIVALSTCAAANTNGRLVVFARMTQHDLLTLEATGYGDMYDAQPHGLTSVRTNYPDGTTIEYSIDGGRTWTTEPPTLRNVGTLTVLIHASHPIYGESDTTEVIRVTPRPITVTVLDATKVEGEDDPVFLAVITGLIDDQEIIYVINRPGVGTDEDVGEYIGALIAQGEVLQGNYTVTYVPGNFTITAAETIVEDEPPLATILKPFEPRGTGNGGRAWALVNLICLIITVYIFIPLMHLRSKYGRPKRMKNINEEKKGLFKLFDLDDEQRAERDLIMNTAVADGREENESFGYADVDEKSFAKAVEKLYFHVRKFVKRFRIGISTELIDSIAAIIAFLLTEDMRLPMILVDRWTPLMIVLMLICWILDVRLMRYRDKVLAEEELKEEKAMATA